VDRRGHLVGRDPGAISPSARPPRFSGHPTDAVGRSPHRERTRHPRHRNRPCVTDAGDRQRSATMFVLVYGGSGYVGAQPGEDLYLCRCVVSGVRTPPRLAACTMVSSGG
jgi:hypothetical protein